MFDVELVRAILDQIVSAASRIERRCTGINEADEFLATEEGLDRLDAICMMLIAIGESLKNVDKITDGKLLASYPSVDWKGAKGMRDIISHHYFDMNAEMVFTICRERVPDLIKAVKQMKKDLE